jgi:hypothetical protein
MKALRADDDDLLDKLQAIPPQERGAALAQIHSRDWKKEPVWSVAHEWLVLAMRLEDAPESPEINFHFGQVTERLRWVARRVPGTRATPETLALSGLKSRQTIGSEGRRRNAERKANAKPWKRIACEIAAMTPRYRHYGKCIEDIINAQLQKKGFKKMAPSTIRKAIASVERPA